MKTTGKNASGRALALMLLVVLISLCVAGCICTSSPIFKPAATAHPAPGSQVTLHPSGAATPTIINVSGSLEVHFLDVGQGDAILIKYGNKSMLVDGGSIEAGPVVKAYLKGHGVSTIDVLVSTHPHSDHIGGLLTVLNEFPVKVVYDSGIPHTTQTYEEYLTLIDRKNIPYKVPQRGDTIDLGTGMTAQVLSPPPGGISGGDVNENSIVLRIIHGGVSFLLESDAGLSAEEAMLNSGLDLESQALKVAHHGSKHASGIAFLRAVGPKYSVIEVGADNPYGHPAPATVARLEEAGSRVYRTDRDGSVIMTSDGKGIVVTTQRSASA